MSGLEGAARRRNDFTPTSASWLNQVEHVFADLITKQLRRGVFKSVASLERSDRAYLDARCNGARPFVWTADADTIHGRIDRYRAAISGSGHSPQARSCAISQAVLQALHGKQRRKRWIQPNESHTHAMSDDSVSSQFVRRHGSSIGLSINNGSEE